MLIGILSKLRGRSNKSKLTDFIFRFRWERVSTILGFSDVDVIWNIPENTEPGSYRIRHFGNYRYILGGVYPYDGTTRIFEVSK